MRKKKQNIVLASGAFDLVHYGHVHFLKEAKKAGGRNARLIVIIARDKTIENLKEAFLHDQDIHQRSASQIFGIPLSKVTHEQRQMGKRINFGIVYGLTPYGLAKDLNIKQSDAKAYIEKYFEISRLTGLSKTFV